MKIEIKYKDVFIQDVKVGDLVKSFDIETEKIRHNRVGNTILPIVEKERQVKVECDDGSQVTTSTTHPMCYFDFDSNKWSYKNTGEIKIGDTLRGQDSEVRVLDIKIGLDEDVQFYDLTVERDNNFFAGEDSDRMIVVHNSATLYFPWWHKEIESIMVLKNNKGTDDNRVRHMDYGIQFEKVFYSRFVSDGDISIFSPSDVPGLYDVFGLPEFEDMYKNFENDKSIPRKTLKARDLMNAFAQERIGTGRMYVMNIDNANTNSPFTERLKMSNLCLDLETSFINSVDVDGVLYESLQLSELIDLYNSGKSLKVLSKNLNTKELEFRNIEKAWITKENTETIEVEDTETGYKIVCTPDHLVYTKNRGWVEAGNLIEDDILDII
jgi:hypothetical protein